MAAGGASYERVLAALESLDFTGCRVPDFTPGHMVPCLWWAWHRGGT
jgi:hypothetical protein